jgi:hypothetical protein
MQMITELNRATVRPRQIDRGTNYNPLRIIAATCEHQASGFTREELRQIVADQIDWNPGRDFLQTGKVALN